MANTLNLFRNGAVGFIDWLDDDTASKLILLLTFRAICDVSRNVAKRRAREGLTVRDAVWEWQHEILFAVWILRAWRHIVRWGAEAACCDESDVVLHTKPLTSG